MAIKQGLERRSSVPDERTDSRLDTRQRIGFRLLMIGLCVALVASITLATMIGPVGIAGDKVWRIVFAQLTGSTGGPWTLAEQNIVWFIRLPRVLLAAVVGAGLSIVGVTIQTMVRNPLADPYLLGISSGASVGATFVIVLGAGGILGVYSLSIAAFIGAILSFAVVFILARQNGRLSPIRLILSGVASAYIFSAITSFLIFRARNDAIQSILFWLLGSFASAKWDYLALPTIVLAAGMIFLLFQSRSLNTLLMGEETAVTLGVDTNRFRQELLIVTALITAVMVAISGAIGFVGLMIPHVVRFVVGSDHRRVLPASLLGGAIFLIWADVLARIAVAPEELPLGVVTALVGAPFFIWLMRRKTSGSHSL